MEKIPRGSTRNCTPSGQEGCNLFQRNANALMFASLVRGTSPRPIVHYLPEVRSLFPMA